MTQRPQTDAIERGGDRGFGRCPPVTVPDEPGKPDGKPRFGPSVQPRVAESTIPTSKTLVPSSTRCYDALIVSLLEAFFPLRLQFGIEDALPPVEDLRNVLGPHTADQLGEVSSALEERRGRYTWP